MSFAEMWASLLPIGRDAETGGYRRFSWTKAELECRRWFVREAEGRGLVVEQDRNGNLFAWWEVGRGAGVVTGSHFDSVPGGGAFDGPLGIVSGFAAVDLLRAEGFTPSRPIGVAAFAEEEGARFGVACLGSRLLTGEIEPGRARSLEDADGITFAEAVADAGRGVPGEGVPGGGLDPELIGRDEELLGRIACFVELHVEQGRVLEVPVGVASAIWPHGRWRLDFHGRGDHAGTTRLEDRRDPMLPFAHAVIAAREAAERHGARATVGKVRVVPGGINAIASQVTAWVDARGPRDEDVQETVGEVLAKAEEAGERHGVRVEMASESYSAVVDFNTELRDRIVKVLEAEPAMTERLGGRVPVLPTGAGHDAGILSAHLPTAMLFVRNPTGVSHAPEERAEMGDCETGVAALAVVLRELAG